MLHCWLLLTLCIFGHSAGSFAVDDEVDASCVDQETLRGFYEKFSLLEKEKESLRNKLSVCTNGQDVLGLSQSQKDGRELRLLESRIAQLEEENKGLREKMNGGEPSASYGSGISEDDSSLSEQEGQGSATIVPQEKPVRPSALPIMEETEGEDSFVPENNSDEENAMNSVDPGVPDKESIPAPLPVVREVEQDTRATALEKLEAESGPDTEVSSITWKAPYSQNNRESLAVDIVSGTLLLDNICPERFDPFLGTFLERVSNPADQKTLQELLLNTRRLLIRSYLAPHGLAEISACPGDASQYFLEKLQALTNRIKDAETGQEVIQAVYQENKVLETALRKADYPLD